MSKALALIYLISAASVVTGCVFFALYVFITERLSRSKPEIHEHVTGGFQ